MNLHELHLEFGHSHHALNHIRRNHFVDSQVLSILLLNAEEWLEVWLLVMSEESAKMSQLIRAVVEATANLAYNQV